MVTLNDKKPRLREGLHQKHGIEHEMVFASLVRPYRIRLFKMVAALDLECHTVDVKSAFVQVRLT